MLLLGPHFVACSVRYIPSCLRERKFQGRYTNERILQVVKNQWKIEFCTLLCRELAEVLRRHHGNDAERLPANRPEDALQPDRGGQNRPHQHDGRHKARRGCSGLRDLDGLEPDRDLENGAIQAVLFFSG